MARYPNEIHSQKKQNPTDSWTPSQFEKVLDTLNTMSNEKYEQLLETNKKVHQELLDKQDHAFLIEKAHAGDLEEINDFLTRKSKSQGNLNVQLEEEKTPIKLSRGRSTSSNDKNKFINQPSEEEPFKKANALAGNKGRSVSFRNPNTNEKIEHNHLPKNSSPSIIKLKEKNNHSKSSFFFKKKKKEDQGHQENTHLLNVSLNRIESSENVLYNVNVKEKIQLFSQQVNKEFKEKYSQLKENLDELNKESPSNS